MRFAILGDSGAGKTTLANALAAHLGVQSVASHVLHLRTTEETTGRLVTIDAGGSRTEVLTQALLALGIGI
jgi:adenylate kinase family enzyme